MNISLPLTPQEAAISALVILQLPLILTVGMVSQGIIHKQPVKPRSLTRTIISAALAYAGAYLCARGMWIAGSTLIAMSLIHAWRTWNQFTSEAFRETTQNTMKAALQETRSQLEDAPAEIITGQVWFEDDQPRPTPPRFELGDPETHEPWQNDSSEAANPRPGTRKADRVIEGILEEVRAEQPEKPLTVQENITDNLKRAEMGRDVLAGRKEARKPRNSTTSQETA